MHGIGNDFVMVDGIRESLASDRLPELARQMNDRRRGIGGDGLIVAERGSEAAFRMRMFNPDGSESEMCGNGVRCFARYLQQQGHTTDSVITVETGAGTLTLEVGEGGLVRVDMGVARLTRGEIGMLDRPENRFQDEPVEVAGRTVPGTAVSMGNPHLVLFVEDASSVEVEAWGRPLEQHPLFPRRTNVHFVQVVDRSHLIQRTWERGAGITLACGTGACASAVAAVVTGRADRSVEITLSGGTLQIEYASDGHVFMTGPAETVFQGMWPTNDF